MPSAKQIATHNKFKLRIKQAKAIQAKDPGKKWSQCLKEAFAL